MCTTFNDSRWRLSWPSRRVHGIRTSYILLVLWAPEVILHPVNGHPRLRPWTGFTFIPVLGLTLTMVLLMHQLQLLSHTPTSTPSIRNPSLSLCSPSMNSRLDSVRISTHYGSSQEEHKSVSPTRILCPVPIKESKRLLRWLRNMNLQIIYQGAIPCICHFWLIQCIAKRPAKEYLNNSWLRLSWPAEKYLESISLRLSLL